MQTNAVEIQAVEVAAIERKIESIPSVTVPLSSLVKSKYNVRKKQPTGIEGLAESIAAVGLLQNLIVHPQGAKKKQAYGVAGGQRRHAALDLLLSQGRIDADFPVDVKIISEADALLMSLTENENREAMAPADQIDAFLALADDGKSLEYIATIFGVTPITVARRLKLANTSPKLRALLRDETMTVEQLSALALTDDHDTQERVWFAAQSNWMREPARLRDAVKSERVRVSTHPLARFVGVETFEAAGGAVLRDLFSNDDECYIEDGELLQRLAAEKFDGISNDLTAEGWSWVHVMPSIDYRVRSSLKRIEPSVRELTQEEADQIAALEAKHNALQRRIDLSYEDAEPEDGEVVEELTGDEQDRIETEMADIESQIDAIQAAAQIWTDDAKASAGVLVYLKYERALTIERGYVQPAAAGDETEGGSSPFVPPQQQPKVRAVHSEKLMQNLSGHQTAAVQAEVMAAQNTALAILAHRMVEGLLYMGYSGDHPAKVSPTSASFKLEQLDGVAESAAGKALDAAAKKWKKALPKSSDARFKWLLTQPQETLVELLAYCTAITIDGVRGDEKAQPLATIAKAVNLDLTQYWTATANSYFNHVSKGRIIEVVTEAVSAKAAEPIASMKKADAAIAAENALREAGAKWLPAPLSGKAEKAAKTPKKTAAPVAAVEPETTAAESDADAEEAAPVAPPALAWPFPTAARLAA